MSTPRQILAAIFDMDGLIFNTERQFFKNLYGIEPNWM